MIDLLSALYDRRSRPVVVVSTYDQTVTYVNAVAAQPGPTPATDVVGLPYRVVLDRWGMDPSESVMLQAIDDLKSGVEKYGRSADGTSWWVASPVPCADPHQPEVLGSEHAGGNDDVSLQRALQEHHVLTERAAVAIEYARVCRLLSAASAAVIDAQRRMVWMGDLLQTAGQRPTPYDLD